MVPVIIEINGNEFVISEKLDQELSIIASKNEISSIGLLSHHFKEGLKNA